MKLRRDGVACLWRDLRNSGQFEIRGILVFSQFLTLGKCLSYHFWQKNDLAEVEGL